VARGAIACGFGVSRVWFAYSHSISRVMLQALIARVEVTASPAPLWRRSLLHDVVTGLQQPRDLRDRLARRHEIERPPTKLRRLPLALIQAARV
jgi:hypothetical protein